MSDYGVQRKNMVESQLRPSDVTDRRILRVMGALPREAFVPARVAALAYMDEPVPLDGTTAGPPRVLTSPRLLAKLLVLADINDTDRVLVVGAATGYSTAVIATLCKSVVALEQDPGLAETARRTLATPATGTGASDQTAIPVELGPLSVGVPARSPFDVIVIDGAIGRRPTELLEQLADGGRCVAVLSVAGVSRATLWRKIGNHIGEHDAFDAATALIPGFEPSKAFTF